MKILFFGTPDFAQVHLEALSTRFPTAVTCVVTQPDRPAGRGLKSLPPPVKECAVRLNIPVLQPGRIKGEKEQFILELSDYGPFDVGIVVAFGQILPVEVLNLPSAGCVNVHASLLPRWRGAAPVHRAIMAGDTETGVCLMQMQEGLDTGPIYFQSACAISPRETGATLHDKLASLGSTLLVEKVRLLSEGSVTPTPQGEAGVTYAAKITAWDQAINWENGAEIIDRQIRAFAPYAGAATFLSGKRFKIFEAEPTSIPASCRAASPGSVLIADGNRLVIRCGEGPRDTADGGLLLKEVQLEGKKRMSASQFQNGSPLDSSDRLGNWE